MILPGALLMTIAAAPLPTQDWVDPGRYAGRWYEIARLPNRAPRSPRAELDRSRAGPVSTTSHRRLSPGTCYSKPIQILLSFEARSR
jgi:hypothetical protein